MTRLRPEDLGGEPVSYAVKHESARAVWLNRIGVTGGLFTVVMALSGLLGRPRR